MAIFRKWVTRHVSIELSINESPLFAQPHVVCTKAEATPYPPELVPLHAPETGHRMRTRSGVWEIMNSVLDMLCLRCLQDTK